MTSEEERVERTRREQEAGERAVIEAEKREWKEELTKKYIHEVVVRTKDDITEVKFTVHKHVDDVREYNKELRREANAKGLLRRRQNPRRPSPVP
jgi:hypothetical protein